MEQPTVPATSEATQPANSHEPSPSSSPGPPEGSHQISLPPSSSTSPTPSSSDNAPPATYPSLPSSREQTLLSEIEKLQASKVNVERALKQARESRKTDVQRLTSLTSNNIKLTRSNAEKNAVLESFKVEFSRLSKLEAEACTLRETHAKELSTLRGSMKAEYQASLAKVTEDHVAEYAQLCKKAKEDKLQFERNNSRMAQDAQIVQKKCASTQRELATLHAVIERQKRDNHLMEIKLKAQDAVVKKAEFRAKSAEGRESLLSKKDEEISRLTLQVSKYKSLYEARPAGSPRDDAEVAALNKRIEELQANARATEDAKLNEVTALNGTIASLREEQKKAIEKYEAAQSNQNTHDAEALDNLRKRNSQIEELLDERKQEYERKEKELIKQSEIVIDQLEAKIKSLERDSRAKRLVLEAGKLSLQKDVAKKNALVEELRGTEEKLESEKAVLKETVNAQEMDLKEHDAGIQYLSEQVTNLEGIINSLEREKSSLERQLQEQQHAAGIEIDTVNKEVSETREQLAAVQAQTGEQLVAKQKECDEFKTQVETASGKLQEQVEKHRDVMQQLTKSEELVAQLESRHAHHNDEVKDIRDKLIGLQEESMSVQEQYDQLSAAKEEEKKSLMEQISDLKKSLEETKEEIHALTLDKIKANKENANVLTNTIPSLKSSLGESHARLEQQEESAMKKDVEITLLHEQVSQMGEMEGDILSLRAQIAELKNQLEHANKCLSARDEQLYFQLDKVKQLKNDISSSEATVEDLDCQMMELKEQHEEKDKELARKAFTVSQLVQAGDVLRSQLRTDSTVQMNLRQEKLELTERIDNLAAEKLALESTLSDVSSRNETTVNQLQASISKVSADLDASKEQCDQYKQSSESIQESLNKLQAEYAQSKEELEKEISSQKQIVENLNESLDKSRDAIQRKSDTETSISEQLKEKELHVSQLEGRLASAELVLAEKDKLKSDLSATVDKISELNTRIETVSSDKSRLEEQVKQLQSDKDTLTNETIPQLEGHLSEKDSKINELTTTVSERDASATKMKEEHNKTEGELKDQVTTLQGQLQSSTSEVESLKKSTDDLKCENSKMVNETIPKLNDDLLESKAKCDGFQLRISAEESNIKQMKKEHAEAESKLKSDISELHAKLDASSTDLSEVKQVVEQSKAENNKLTTDTIPQLEKDVDAGKTQIAQLTSELSQKQESLAKLEMEHASAKEGSDKLIEVLRVNLRNANAKCEELEKQVSELTAAGKKLEEETIPSLTAQLNDAKEDISKAKAQLEEKDGNIEQLNNRHGELMKGDQESQSKLKEELEAIRKSLDAESSHASMSDDATADNQNPVEMLRATVQSALNKYQQLEEQSEKLETESKMLKDETIPALNAQLQANNDELIELKAKFSDQETKATELTKANDELKASRDDLETKLESELKEAQASLNKADAERSRFELKVGESEQEMKKVVETVRGNVLEVMKSNVVQLRGMKSEATGSAELINNITTSIEKMTEAGSLDNSLNSLTEVSDHIRTLIGNLDEANTKYSDEVGSVRDELKKHEREHDDELKKLTKEKEEVCEKLSNAINANEKALASKKELEAKSEEDSESIRKAQAVVSDLKGTVEQYEKKEAEYNEKLDRFRNSMKALESRYEKLFKENEEAMQSKRQELSERNEHVTSLRQELQKAREERDDESSKVKNYKAATERLERRLQAKVKELEEEVDDERKAASEAGQKAHAALQDVQASNAKQEQLQADYNHLKRGHDSLVSKYEASVKQVETEKDNTQQAEKRRRVVLSELEAKKEDEVKHLARIEQLQADVADSDKLKIEVKSLQEECQELNASVIDYNRLQKKYNSCLKKLQRAKAQLQTTAPPSTDQNENDAKKKLKRRAASLAVPGFGMPPVAKKVKSHDDPHDVTISIPRSPMKNLSNLRR